MKTLQENRTANGLETQRHDFVAPEVDIFETEEGYVLQAEMPGVSKEGLEITLEGNQVTITGRRHRPTETGEMLFRERARADFRRVFEIDPAIDSAKIHARMDQGILTLNLPKSEQVKPRKIPVKD